MIISGHVNVGALATLTVEAGLHVVFTDAAATLVVHGEVYHNFTS